MKLKETTQVTGFQEPVTTVEILEGSIDELISVLGTSSWNEIPEELRRNDRMQVGRLRGPISARDLIAEEDWNAIRICIDEARNRTKKTIVEYERII